MENNKKLFTEEDFDIAVSFLEEKKVLQKNSRKKYEIETYLDNGGNSLVVVSSKKRPALLKNLLDQKVLAVYEIRANEDYSVVISLPNASEPAYANRDIYYPHFKQEYLSKMNEQKVEEASQSK